MQKKTILLYMLNLLFFTSLTACAQDKILYAGIAKTSLLPETKTLLQGETVHDTLYVKTIILDNKQNKVAFMIADSQGIAQFIIEEAKQKIHEATSFPIENIVVASTHTHSGIVASTSPENFKKNKLTAYQEFLVQALTTSFITAYNTLQPVEIAWGSFDKPDYVFNRRWYTKELNVNPLGGMDSVKMNPGNQLRPDLIKPAGPTDSQIGFIALRTLDKTPLAILANYSLHYVGGIEKNTISADYFGVFDTEINKLLNHNKINPHFIGIMSNGTSGDVNNNDYSKKLPTYPPYEKMKSIAHNIAESLAKEYQQLSFKNWIPLHVNYEEIALEKRIPDVQLKANFKKINTNKSSKQVFHSDEKYYVTRCNYYEKTYPNTITVPLQVIELGDIVINTIPFEVFAETGLELKKRSAFAQSFTIGLANGHWGYLPTPEQHLKGGYETWLTVNRVEKNSSRIITEQIINMQNQIKKR
ncbi:neutral/alkaline non-lysosomal ceramidase N-terminal domain-containing protein [Myroides odoratus]|uniref:neutral/alkaline non-lysosomal ceramidase N-terminal domain-containing protein n=1 Tax=Myroides odoratus TaxID=256 RepID=UPI00076619EE|nr:neutral/alkaline non-lysosomal ceramidase N-terminal domain-containing protein [Myroides odoratus]